MSSTKHLKIAFIHPDLGIGGAERLVVDAAKGLKSKGHDVVIYTSHHDRQHCFEETKDGTLEVRVRGDTVIPRTFRGSFHM
ncbi:8064_t:CDS:2, partial [Acaulospora morrowiae]